MALYRIKQFYWGITSKIDLKDKRFLNQHLSEKELMLFNKLNKHEKKHCIKTAMDAEVVCLKNNVNNKILIKAALLHDIGKIDYNTNLIQKSFMVVLNKLFKDKMRKYEGYKVVDVFYNHPENGYKILKNYDYDERFLYLIKNHHNNDIIGDKELDILKQCDNKN
ncbi:HDIG domain-containing protein [Clostridium sp. MB40-C1]|uniref:HDIG domain-containing metalloprotein n=1 Tax=Clostridium sp. MB40-C1 TaxID=3070996 RepID=UPI0027E0AB87|nr:HDIG domain-containing metalloprotein [Clostridium sp. MB40-C1]WMJ80066.1 HDIG domain-containing protein [Clostridium sp. MB40-C1]